MSKFALFLLVFWVAAPLAKANERFDLRDGDRVALVGDTFIEREQESGWLETEMAADFQDRHFIVRNLGWSADTPAGASRASFDFADPQKGFELLTEELAQTRPTVVFIGYGMASSFDGEADLDKFKSDLNRFIDMAEKGTAGQTVRFVILSPIRHQKLPAPLPDPARHNAQLALYVKALREIAGQRGFPLVDLYDWKPNKPARVITDDGIHLTPVGYEAAAAEIARQLGWKRSLAKANPKLVEQLRRTIIDKDQLFFDRWRPQNETYLFGFRKYEQGKNAREIGEFDPLVKTQEDRIAHFQEMLSQKMKAEPVAPRSLASQKPAAPQPLPDFQVAPGFEVTLWAEDPMIAKPIQMNFDPQGRLWVASSSLYPQITPGQTPDDKIVVLEDTKHLGKADKSTVFADGLFIPQGIEPGDGGCYVGQSTELLHFTASRGSGKADQRRVVLSGFGTEDTHHMVHTLAWGPDGMLYFDQSIYIHSHIETPTGAVRLNSGGVFHLRPASMKLDVYLRGFCNPWGHEFDSFGQSFVTDGAGNQGISWGIPGATYFTYAQMRRELPSISPGHYPKFCGLAIVASQQFPDDWQGDFLTADFRANRIVRFSRSDDGAGYVTKEMPDLLRSANDTFRPVDLKFGPDGALYVADWDNPIINHGEVDFRDPRRDHVHGRIWRITAKGRPLVPRLDLAQAGDQELFGELLSSNSYDVQQSRRVLTERGKRILRHLKKWTARQTDEKALLQALWIYQSIDARNDSLLDKVLQARDGRIRAAGVRILSYWPRATLADSGPDKGLMVPQSCYERALADANPRVRAEALRALVSVPSLRSAALALDTLQRPMDSFEDYALWLTINDLAEPWLAGVHSGAWSVEGHENQTAFALNAIEPALASSALDDILKARPLDHHGSGPWIELIGRCGSPAAIDLLYHQLVEDNFDQKAAERAWAALAAAGDSRHVKPKTDLDQIVKSFGSGAQASRIQSIHLAGDWGGPGSSVTQLVALAKANQTPPPVRAAAFESLKKIGGPKTVAALRPLADKTETPAIRRGAVLTLAAIDVRHCGPSAVSFLSGLSTEKAALPVWHQLLSYAGVGPVLADALPRNGFPTVISRAGIRAVRDSGLSEPELIVALSRTAELPEKQAELTPAETKQLVAAVLKEGNPAHGELIFRRAQQSCLTCHSIGGAGGKVGPDLTSLGASSPVDYLIDSVLYPSKEIKDGYQAYLIETTDGEELSGIPVRENDRELVLRTAAGQETVVLKSEIKTKKPRGSLMPTGLADNLSNQERIDLFRFLSELGKPGPFDAAKGDVARLWAVTPDPLSSPEQEKLIASNLKGEPWHAVTSLVDGRLLGDDLKNAVVNKKSESPALLAGARFRSVKDGIVRFDLTGFGHAPAWIDGKSVSHSDTLATDLPAGAHTIIVKLEANELPALIRLQSNDGTFLQN